jgi:sortase A
VAFFMHAIDSTFSTVSTVRTRIQPAASNNWGPLPPHAARPRPPRLLPRIVEYLLLLVATVSLGYYAYANTEAYLYQAYEDRALDQILASRQEITPSSATPAPAAPILRPSEGELIGRIEIPRLNVSAIVRAGSDARTLGLAVGHIPGTAFPGESGNVGLAGHRDTFFRRLRDIRSDDEIRLLTTKGTFAYRVAETSIVLPGDVWVLDPTERPTLTLITCYPFTYIGSAPKRFVVRATLDSPLQDVSLPLR